MGTRAIVRWVVGVLAGLTVLVSLAVPAGAATVSSGSGNGLKISPVTTNITIAPGHTHTVTVYIQNVTQGTIELRALINDFTASNDESGTPALLLDANQYAPTHSLKRLVAPIANFTLKPGEQRAVPVTVTIPDGAPGGGYYGAVRFAPATSGTENNVTLSASVASLILVKVPGEIKEEMRLLSMDVRSGASGTPRVLFTGNKGLVATVRFQNKGDVQEQPFGKILLERGGKVLASYEVNNATPRGNVLPDSIRKFTVNVDKVGMFGKYTLVGNFGYGANGQLLSGQTTFYVVPLAAILLVIALILVIIFFIFGFPKLVRAYNQRVLRKAGRR